MERLPVECVNRKLATATVITRYRLFSLLLLIRNFPGATASAREEAGLVRAELLPLPDRGRRRMKHCITSFDEEGSDGT